MDHGTVITKLGGSYAVAARLGCHFSRPYRWAIGSAIPPERWLEVVELAAELGQPDITVEALATGRRQARQATRQVAA